MVDKNDRAPALGKLNSDNTVTVRIDRSDLTAALGKAGKTDCDGLTFVAEAEEFTQGSMNRMFTDENAFDPADKTRYRVTSTSNPVVCRSYESVWVALHANDPALGTVSVGSSTGADASAEFSAMTKGVTVTATPTPGAHFVGWRNADGELVSVQATYELPALTGHTMLLADFAGNAGGNLGGTFADVDPAAWYYKAVGYVLKEGLMNGVSAKHFSPDGTFTRAMLCQVFYNMAGRPAVTATGRFSDLEDGRWYCDAVAWATETGLVLGYGNGCFGPDDALTREQLAVVLYRYEQTCGGGLTGDPAEKVPDFKDAGQISPWAAEAMQWCVIKTILSGRGDGALDPQGTATRAETAQVLMNYLGRT